MGGREGVPLLGVVNTYKSWMDASLVQLGSVSVKGVIVVYFSGYLMWWVSLRSMSFEWVVCVVKARRIYLHPINTNAALPSSCVVRVPRRRTVIFYVATSNFHYYYHAKVSNVHTSAPPLPRAFVKAKENDRGGKSIEGAITRRFRGFVRLVMIRVCVVAPIVTFVNSRERGRRFKFRNDSFNGAVQVNGY